MTSRFKLGATAALLFVGGLLAVATSPAAATNACSTVEHTNLADVKTLAKDEVTPTNGTATLTDRGVRATTPDAAAKVYTYFPSTVDLADVQSLGYETRKYDTTAPVVLPSYQLGVDVNGPAAGGFTTLVFEPYLQPATVLVASWQSWNPFAGVWWSTNVIPGQPNRDTRSTLTQVKSANPDAVLVYYGLSLGSGNAGADVRFDALRFKADGVCKQHEWSTPKTEPTKSPTAQPTKTATPAPTKSGVPHATVPAGTGGGGKELALTGPAAGAIAGAATVLLLLGGGLLLLTRRRKTRFVA